jgi:hypothetical protein
MYLSTHYPTNTKLHMLVPRFCTGIQCTENTTGLANWSGPYQQRNDSLLGHAFLEKFKKECDVFQIFNGTEDDEWSILFEYTDVNSTFVEDTLWAELWYDHEDEHIHCLVRSCRQQGQITYGPNAEQPYFRATPLLMLGDLECLLETCEYVDLTTNIEDPVYLETERQKSRDYKRFHNERCKTALAMALHNRLGEDSAIACLGGDILSTLLIEYLN